MADSILMVCCMGKHLETPTGMYIRFPSTTPKETNIAEAVSFLVFTFNLPFLVCLYLCLP